MNNINAISTETKFWTKNPLWFFVRKKIVKMVICPFKIKLLESRKRKCDPFQRNKLWKLDPWTAHQRRLQSRDPLHGPPKWPSPILYLVHCVGNNDGNNKPAFKTVLEKMKEELLALLVGQWTYRLICVIRFSSGDSSVDFEARKGAKRSFATKFKE